MEVLRKRAKVKKKKAKPLDGNLTTRTKMCSFYCFVIRFTGTGYVSVELPKETVSDEVSYSIIIMAWTFYDSFYNNGAPSWCNNKSFTFHHMTHHVNVVCNTNWYLI